MLVDMVAERQESGVATGSGSLRERQRRFLVDKWSGRHCLLDGQVATICGRLNRFATVAAIGRGPSAEFAWETVGRVMECGGKFTT